MGYTRDINGLKSHAQKHFIKLYIENKELPLKVQETGKGYTLSGTRALDPNSASYKAGMSKKHNKDAEDIPKKVGSFFF